MNVVHLLINLYILRASELSSPYRTRLSVENLVRVGVIAV